MRPLGRFALAVVPMLTLAACGTEDAAVRWELSVTNLAGEPFAVRILLDGTEVYAQSSPVAATYTATLEGRYELAEHVVECEIGSSVGASRRYVAGVKYTIVSDGRAAIIDGAPMDVLPGNRLRVVVSLAAEIGY